MATSEKLAMSISGMHCAGCVATIEKGVRRLEGVDDCQVNLAMRSAVVTYDQKSLSPESIFSQIEELGFEPGEVEEDIFETNRKESRVAKERFVLSIALSVPLMIVAMWPMIIGGWLVTETIDPIMQAIMAIMVFALAGRDIIIDAYQRTIRGQANMNSLVALGTLTAFGWSFYLVLTSANRPELYFDSVGMIITLILLGRFWEARIRGGAGEAILALLKLRPATTTALINGVEVEIDPVTAKPGMTLIVKAGQKVPADGQILEGMPNVDESMLTGESIPVEKKVGDPVIGGSLNGNVGFILTVTASADKSFLSEVVRMVAEAQARKAPVQALADRVASIFVPIVLLIALMTLAGWYFLDPGNPLMIKSVVSVLIIACPCALGLATPTAVLAGTSRAAREGIIIRGGDILEKLNEIDTIVFDKTGTLTHGEMHVIAVHPFGNFSESHLIRLVGSVESFSDHPVASALTDHMRHQALKPLSVKNVVTHPGFGLVAEFDGRPVIIGSKSLMRQEKIELGEAKGEAEEHMQKGQTVVFAALEGQIIGVIALADRLRGEARDIVAKLKSRVGRVMMLSGDNRMTADGVAKALGLDTYEAEVRPDQKKDIVQSLQKAGFKVAMVGDGINDAPALASAQVGIAIGSGTDVALETADVVLVRSNLNNLGHLFEVASQSLKTIKANLFWALFYNIVAIPVAAGLLYPFTGLTLSPIIAAAAMSFSSFFVVTNSLRLSRISLD